jgi:hypothetical protein
MRKAGDWEGTGPGKFGWRARKVMCTRGAASRHEGNCMRRELAPKATHTKCAGAADDVPASERPGRPANLGGLGARAGQQKPPSHTGKRTPLENRNGPKPSPLDSNHTPRHKRRPLAAARGTIWLAPRFKLLLGRPVRSQPSGPAPLSVRRSSEQYLPFPKHAARLLRGRWHACTRSDARTRQSQTESHHI